MKIAYLTNQYPKISHTFIRREILALEALGCKVERFSLRGAPEELADPRDREESLRTRVILDSPKPLFAEAAAKMALRHPSKFARAVKLASELGRPSERGSAFQYVYLAEACVFALWCKEAEIEHVHVHFGTNPTSVAMLAHAMGGPSFSFTVHGPEEFDKAHLIHLRKKIERAKFVVAISHFGRSQLFRHCDQADWKKIQVVRCGVDDQFLQDGISPIPQTNTVVCVGRLSEQKGQLLLIEAVGRLRDEGVAVKLVLVGDGEMRQEIETRLAELDLGAHVTITGWASGDEVRGQLLAAKALVLPSFAEGLPVVIMEAMALGRPVLSTYVAGIPELVRPTESGWLVRAGSVEHLTAGLKEVLAASPESLALLAQGGRELVATEHDVATNALMLLELIQG